MQVVSGVQSALPPHGVVMILGGIASYGSEMALGVTINAVVDKKDLTKKARSSSRW